MNSGEILTGVVRNLRARLGDAPTDLELLARFAQARDEGAFAELISRYGGLVLGVARRQLADRQQAEDIFQATFVALARQAPRLTRRTPLANWLYTVALRLARQARITEARRSARDRRLGVKSTPPDPLIEVSGRELLGIIEEELDTLPKRYRLPLLLCGLDGLARDEAAARLGWTLGTLRGHLQRGRELLRKRLAARGVTAPAALTAVLLADPATALPPGLVATTTRAALALPVASGVSVKGFAAAALLLTALGTGAVLLPGPRPAAPANPPLKTATAAADALGDPLPVGARRRFGTTRFRHGEQILALALTLDGMTAATGGIREIRLWDTATGRLRGSIRAPYHVLSLSFSADGRRLTWAGSLDDDHRKGELVVWDITDGKRVTTVQHAGWVRVAALTPDGKTALMSCDDGTLRLLDADTGAVRHDLGRVNAHGAAAVLSPDGKLLAAGGRNQSVAVWEVASGIERHRLPEMPALRALAFSPAATELVTVHTKGLMEESTIRLWDLAPGRERWSVRIGAGKPFSGGVASLRFAPDGRRLATGDYQGTTEVRDAATGKSLWQHTDGTGTMHGVRFAPDSRTLYSAGTNGRMLVFAAVSGESHFHYYQHTGGVVALSESPDHRTLATGGADRTLRLWDLSTGRTRAVLPGHVRGVFTAQFLRDGRLVSSGGDGTVRVWDSTTGRELEKWLAPEKGWNGRTALSPDGMLLAASEVGAIRLFDVAMGKVTREIRGHDGYIMDMVFSPNGKYVATAAHAYSGEDGHHDDWSVRVWSVATGEQLFRRDPLYPHSPAFTQDGNGLFFRGRERTKEGTAGRELAVVVDFQSGAERPAPTWAMDVGRALYSSGGAWMASTHADGTICVRSARNGQEALPFRPNAGSIYNLLWSADGRTLWSANGDTTVLEWDLAPAAGGPPLTADSAWTDLLSADGPTAYRAAWWFLNTPDAVGTLAHRLKPAADGGMAERIRILVAALDGERFAAREAAQKDLVAIGPTAEPALTRALTDGTPETQRRAREILMTIRQQELTAARWRDLAAVEVLERIGTAAAREHLRRLAAGAAGARLTAAAAEALMRLGQPAH